MTVKFSDLSTRAAMYSFVGDDGENIHIASGLLYEWVQRNRPNLEVVLVPIDPVRAASYVRDNVVSKKRCRELLIHINHLQPMIFGEAGTYTRGLPDLYHIDGHHRLVVYAHLNRPFAEAYILQQSQWRPFQIEGVPDITKEMLNQMPIKPRDYTP